MQKFFYDRQKSNSESESSHKQILNTSEEIKDLSIAEPSNGLCKEGLEIKERVEETSEDMNFIHRNKSTNASLREAQTALAAALESMKLKDRIISALENEIRAQEEEISLLKKDIKGYQSQLAVTRTRYSIDCQANKKKTLFEGMSPEATYPDLSTGSSRPKRFAISAEPPPQLDALPSAPKPIDKSDRLVSQSICSLLIK